MNDQILNLIYYINNINNMTKENILREIAIYHANKGRKGPEIFEYLAQKVSLRTIQNWIKIYKEENRIQASFSPGRPRSQTNHIQKAKIKKLVLKGKSARTVKKILSKKKPISLQSVNNALKELNLKVIYP